MEEGDAVRGVGGTGGDGGGGNTPSPTPQPPSNTSPASARSIKENLANLLELKKAHTERLHRIEEELTHLHRFKKDYEHLYKRLKSLPDKTTHEVMVPLGRLALVPGQLVHTNEVMVLLGDNWFAERSAKQAMEIVRRRIKDCEDKLRSAENNRRLHAGWLQEAEELLAGEAGQQVEILEEVSEEEYARSKEEHRQRVAEEYARLRRAAPQRTPSPINPPSSPPPPPDPFLEGLGEGERKSYEELMKRLDQLELEEMGDGMEPLEEEDEEEEEEEEEEEGIYNKEEDKEEEEEEEEEDDDERKQIIPSPQAKSRRLKFRRRLHSAEEPSGGPSIGWRKGFGGGTMSMDNTDSTDGSDLDGTDDGGVPGGGVGASGGGGGRHLRLRRRVSWADDIRPLYTIIPDDSSAEVHRIPYSSTPASPAPPPPQSTTSDPPKPLTLPLHSLGGVRGVGDTEGGIQSPSDLYRVFGQPPPSASDSPKPPPHPSSAPPVPGPPNTPPPKSILKKCKSLPVQGGEDTEEIRGGGLKAEEGSVVGWCCPPKPLDLEGEEEGEGEKAAPTPPPPPSPPPKRAHKMAFSYRVLESKAAAGGPGGVSGGGGGDGPSPTPPKKISKFRATRMKK